MCFNLPVLGAWIEMNQSIVTNPAEEPDESMHNHKGQKQLSMFEFN